MLAQILRAFHYRDRHVYISLYKQYVRPHLEFAVAAWSPWTKADIECLEKVQMKAVRAVSGLRGRSYEESSVADPDLDPWNPYHFPGSGSVSKNGWIRIRIK